VGGVAKSWHRWSRGGLAVDMHPDATMDAASTRIHLENAAVDAEMFGLDAITHDTYIHLEPADG
jgi:hypothetical protein